MLKLKLLKTLSIELHLVGNVGTSEDTRITPIIKYLEDGTLPKDGREAKKV